jgi:hypothetical protein
LTSLLWNTKQNLKGLDLYLTSLLVTSQVLFFYRENFERMIKVDALKEDIEAFRLEQETWKEIQKIKFEAEER